jgi:hypothetical protein
VFFSFLLLYCPVIVCLINCIFGIVLAMHEGWTIWVGFLYVSSTVCGLGNPLTAATPVTVGGKTFDVLTALWSVSIAGTIMGVASALSAATLFIDYLNARTKWCKGWAMFFLVALIAVPLLCTLIALIAGGIIALCEGWLFGDGFLYAISTMTGLSAPLTALIPETAFGEVVSILVAVCSLTVSSTVIGSIGGLSAAEGSIQKFIGFTNCFSQRKSKRYWAARKEELDVEEGVNDGSEDQKPSVLQILFTMLVAVPLFVCLICLGCACILAFAEKSNDASSTEDGAGAVRRLSEWDSHFNVHRVLRRGAGHGNVLVDEWTIWNTFLYVAGNICGLPNPLVPMVPRSHVGVMVDLVVAIWVLTLYGLVIGVVASHDWLVHPLHGIIWRFEKAVAPVARGLYKYSSRMCNVCRIKRVGVAVEAAGGEGAAGAEQVEGPGRRIGGSEAKGDRDTTVRGGNAHAERLFASIFGVAIFSGLAVPAVCAVISVAFGGVLALAEDWRFHDGFEYVLSALAAMCNPLTPATPATDGGDACVLVIMLLALSLEAVMLGMIANFTALRLTADRLNTVDTFPKADLAKRLGELEAAETALTEEKKRLELEKQQLEKRQKASEERHIKTVEAHGREKLEQEREKQELFAETQQLRSRVEELEDGQWDPQPILLQELRSVKELEDVAFEHLLPVSPMDVAFEHLLPVSPRCSTTRVQSSIGAVSTPRFDVAKGVRSPIRIGKGPGDTHIRRFMAGYREGVRSAQATELFESEAEEGQARRESEEEMRQAAEEGQARKELEEEARQAEEVVGGMRVGGMRVGGGVGLEERTRYGEKLEKEMARRELAAEARQVQEEQHQEEEEARRELKEEALQAQEQQQTGKAPA